jgi:hypothetical protein
MDSDRFLKYIQGGELVINGRVKTYTACPDDINSPEAEEPYLLNRGFYFGGTSGTWNNHGVGFISPRQNSRSIGYSKIYLISNAQFNHLFALENGRTTVNINYDEFKRSSKTNFDFRLYNQIILLNANYKGHPILTFTNSKRIQANAPMPDYIKLIANGLRLTHDLSNKKIIQYFSKANVGITNKELNKILQ